MNMRSTTAATVKCSRKNNSGACLRSISNAMMLIMMAVMQQSCLSAAASIAANEQHRSSHGGAAKAANHGPLVGSDHADADHGGGAAAPHMLPFLPGSHLSAGSRKGDVDSAPNSLGRATTADIDNENRTLHPAAATEGSTTDTTLLPSNSTTDMLLSRPAAMQGAGESDLNGADADGADAEVVVRSSARQGTASSDRSTPLLEGSLKAVEWQSSGGLRDTLNQTLGRGRRNDGELHPLPPNMGMSLVADVAGTTKTDDAYWAEKCKIIPSNTAFLVLDMGAVRDFIKPTDGNTYCEMLQANNKHQWSPNGVDWFAVEFYVDTSNHNGGSNHWWPRDKGVGGDVRMHLSFWGYDDPAFTGGCCSTRTTAAYTGGSWGQSFTVSYVVLLHPLPPNTGMSLVADVASATNANGAYWAEKCKIVPSSTLFLVLDMGAVRDFFRPTEGSTYCDMLKARNKHQWSPNGVDWFDVEFDTYAFSSRNQNCDDACQVLGSGNVCDRDATGAVNSEEKFAAVATQITGHTGTHCTGFGTYMCEGEGAEHVPFMDVWNKGCQKGAANCNGKCYYCPDTAKTLCNVKHVWRSRICACKREWWPRDKGQEGDVRKHLSIWGHERDDIKGGCCSTSTAVAVTGSTWEQSFTLSYVVPLQPLPPNTGISLVADVASTTKANDAFWSDKCKTISSDAAFLVLDMGAVRDFFKPTEGNTYCEMLQARDKHQWSPNGVDWFAVEFYSNSDHNGGSAAFWPRDKGQEGDARNHLSYWGHDGQTGGCCSTSTAEGYAGWGQSFTVSFVVFLQPLPPATGMSLVADVAGTTKANDAYWSAKCKTIPSNTAFLVLDMGAVRDFFRPTEGNTYCTMLRAANKHQWSPNGVDWVEVDFRTLNDHNGGSDSFWPRDKGQEKDVRNHLSFWGHDGQTGGCCSTSTAEGYAGWAIPFTLSYSYAKTTRTMKLSTLLVRNTKTKSEDDGSGKFWIATVHNGASLGDGRLPGFPQALTFDGKSQSVSIDGGVMLGGGALSICAWIKSSKFQDWSRVIGIGNGQTNDNIILYNRGNTGTLIWNIFRGDEGKHVDIGNILKLNTWTHVCASVDTAGTMTVFVNGAEQKCTSGTACATSTGKGSNGWTPNRLPREYAYIGADKWDTATGKAAQNFFAGSISDLTIMDGHAITSDAEAADIMRSSGMIRTMALSELDDGLSGTKTYSDLTASGHWTGSVQNGAALGPGRLPGSQALTFNGKDQYVSIDDAVTIGGGALSICAWIKWTKFQAWSRVVEIGNGQASDSISLFNVEDTNTLRWSIFRGDGEKRVEKRVDIGDILKLDTWTHVCASVDTPGTMTVFVNGAEQKCTDGAECDTATGRGTHGWTPNRLLRNNAYIGAASDASGVHFGSFFAGSISDLVVMDQKAITAAEARALMDAAGSTATTSTTTTVTTLTTTTKGPGAACSDSSECSLGPCRIRCCKAGDATYVACKECDSGGFCGADIYEAKCGAGEAYSEATFGSTGNITLACSPCQPGTTQDAPDVCTPCPADEVEGYTIAKHVGTCSELATGERVAKLAAAQAEADASGGDGGSGGLSTAGKITIPLGILGFLGGLVIGWYRLKSDKKAKAKAKQKQAEFQEEMRASMSMYGQKSPKKKKASKKKKPATKEKKESSQVKHNPMYDHAAGDNVRDETEQAAAPPPSPPKKAAKKSKKSKKPTAEAAEAPEAPEDAAAGGGGYLEISVEEEQVAAPGAAASFTSEDVGKAVRVEDYGKGTLRFVGEHHKNGELRCGVELDKPIGNHNGTVKGHCYFTCQDSFGMGEFGVLVKPPKVKFLKKNKKGSKKQGKSAV